MSDVNNVEQLRLWFRECPAISKQKRFGVDYVSESPTEYAIYAVPSGLKYHENILGERVLDDIQTQNFIFASKEPYGQDVLQNLQNLKFHQDVVEWIQEQNAAQSFPEWDEGRIRSIVPTLTAHVSQVGSNTAKYQIQLAIQYKIL